MDEMQPAIRAVEECVDIIANKLYRAGKLFVPELQTFEVKTFAL